MRFKFVFVWRHIPGQRTADEVGFAVEHHVKNKATMGMQVSYVLAHTL